MHMQLNKMEKRTHFSFFLRYVPSRICKLSGLFMWDNKNIQTAKIYKLSINFRKNKEVHYESL